MPKQNRVARTKDDLKRELEDQLDNLRMSCIAYDNGNEAAGKTIAGTLRVLLYSRGEHNRGLLDQLGYRAAAKFVSSCDAFDEENYAPRVTILQIRVTEHDVQWSPKLHSDPHCSDSRKLSFTDWWSEEIAVDGKTKRFTRMNLVMNVADTDGGAHVDAGLVDSYMDLTRGNSLGYWYGDNELPLVGRPVLACMRQIAQEIIATLKAYAPELGERVEPIVPLIDPPPTGVKGPKLRIKGSLPEHLRGIENLQGSFSLAPVRRKY